MLNNPHNMKTHIMLGVLLVSLVIGSIASQNRVTVEQAPSSEENLTESNGLEAESQTSSSATLNRGIYPMIVPRVIEYGTVDSWKNQYFVSISGNDQTGNGTAEQPWATITHALSFVSDNSLILVQPGTYIGSVDLNNTFEHGVTVRSAVPYKALLRNDDTVVTGFYGQGITLEGFDIGHLSVAAKRYVIQIQDLRGGQPGNHDRVERLILRNNIIHDSFNNDLIKINNGAGRIIIDGNMFYNQASGDSHIDVNSVTDVIIQDNIFFNDFAGSGRENNEDTASYIVVKDSNGTKDANIGSRNIIIRRNIMLNWQGRPGNTFIVVGEDAVSYFQAQDVLIENNLLIGNSANLVRAAFGIKGSRDIIIRHNTIVGDMPARAYMARLNTQENNPNNRDIYIFGNIWSDPTGTMGARTPSDANDFSDTPRNETDSFALSHNLYWNGGFDIPEDREELINYSDDANYIIGDPLLGTQENLILPRWKPEQNQFADGSSNIRDVFERLVNLYGQPAENSPVVDASDSAIAPRDDILGQPRTIDQAPDIGAYERQ